jgi:hypothetical protein
MAIGNDYVVTGILFTGLERPCPGHTEICQCTLTFYTGYNSVSRELENRRRLWAALRSGAEPELGGFFVYWAGVMTWLLLSRVPDANTCSRCIQTRVLSTFDSFLSVLQSSDDSRMEGCLAILSSFLICNVTSTLENIQGLPPHYVSQHNFNLLYSSDTAIGPFGFVSVRLSE